MKDGKISFFDKIGSYVMTLFAPSWVLKDVNPLSVAIGFGASGLQWGVSETLRIRKAKRSNPYSYLLSLRNDGKVMFR